MNFAQKYYHFDSKIVAILPILTHKGTLVRPFRLTANQMFMKNADSRLWPNHWKYLTAEEKRQPISLADFFKIPRRRVKQMPEDETGRC